MTVRRTAYGDREAQLLVAAQQGDLASWNDLVACYLPEIKAICYFELRHHETAEDACIETFLKAQISLSRFKGGSFGAWVTTIARNTCADELRKQRRRERTIQLAGGAQETLALLDFLSRQEAVDRFRQEEQAYGSERLFEVLCILTPFQRRALMLNAINDRPTSEIAKRCGTSPNRVRAELRTAKRILRNYSQWFGINSPSRRRPPRSLADQHGSRPAA